MEQTSKHLDSEPKKVFVKGYVTSSGRIVPGHYRSTSPIADVPKGTYIERRLVNPKKPR